MNVSVNSVEISLQPLSEVKALTGKEALTAFLSTLQPKDGSRELWLKCDHDHFYKAIWTEENTLRIKATKLPPNGDSEGRQVYGDELNYEFLYRLTQRVDGGAFYIPTQPQKLPLAKYVTSTDTLSAEIDQGSTEEQWSLYQYFSAVSGLEWASLLTSGSKSIHGHIKCTEHIPFDDMQYLRRLLVIAMQSDPVTVRPWQPMRIPGFHRKEKGNDQALLSYSTKRYTYDEILDGLKKWFYSRGLAVPERFTYEWWQMFHNALKNCAQLEQGQRFIMCKELLEDGLEAFEARLEAERKDREARKAKALEKYKHTIGRSLSEQLEDAYAVIGDSAFADSMHNWKYATGQKARGCCAFHESQSGTSAWIAPMRDGSGWGYHCTACTDDKPINPFQYWWYRTHGFGARMPRGAEYAKAVGEFLAQFGFQVEKRQYKKPEAITYPAIEHPLAEQGYQAVVNSSYEMVLSNTRDEIRSLVNSSLSKSLLELKKLELRGSSGLELREFNMLWQAVEAEEAEDEFDPRELELLLESKVSKINLDEIIDEKTARLLNFISRDLGLRQEVYLMSLLTTVGSVAKNGTKLTLKRDTGYSVSPNLYTAIVAPSSQRKTPAINAVATAPLRILNKCAKEDYEYALKDWEARYKEATKKQEEFNEPKPSRATFYFTGGTNEGLQQQVASNPQNGIMRVSDELAGLFKSQNMYRNGRGADGEDMLSYYDNGGALSLLVSGVRDSQDGFNFGILGGIQPKVLMDMLGKNCEDSNGNWARFIFVNQPVVAARMGDDSGSKCDITEYLAGIYQRIADFPAREYLLEKQSFEYFRDCFNRLEDLRVEESNPAMQSVIGKTAGRIGKLALGIHLFMAAQKGEQPTENIPLETLKKAVKIAKFAIEQVRAIYAQCNTENFTTHLMHKVIEMSKAAKCKAIKAADVQKIAPRDKDGKAMKANEVRAMFLRMEELGHGYVEGEGKKLTFTAGTKDIVKDEPVETTFEPPTQEPEPIPEPEWSEETIEAEVMLEGQSVAVDVEQLFTNIDAETSQYIYLTRAIEPSVYEGSNIQGTVTQVDEFNGVTFLTVKTAKGLLVTSIDCVTLL